MKFPHYFSAPEQTNSRPLRALIDLTAFKKNVATTQSLVGDSNLIIVVKADAYGHGLLEVARTVRSYDLAVAIPDELSKLREAGIKNKVWVLEGFFSIDSLMKDRSAIWVIHSFWQLELLKEAIRNQIISSLNICIKLDTGMHRLGFCEEELPAVKQYIAEIPEINIHAMMSHFSMSEQPDNSTVVSQIDRFDSVIQKNNLATVKQSLANSGGIIFYPQSHRDWVRPGIMLYGSNPSHTDNGSVLLDPVMSFQSAIIAIHSVNRGESVGYGGIWTAEQDSMIATIAVGYADGYPRHAPCGTPVVIIDSETGKIKTASLAGRVSMDMITVDITHLNDVSVGDSVELWGKHLSVGSVAELSGTISYELLTSVSKRVPKVYIG